MKASASKEEIVLKVESLVKDSKGKASPQDISSSTGYALNEVMDALARLIELYEVRVNMDRNNGNLQFLFEYPFKKRGSKSIKELLYIATSFLWKLFTYLYKASIGIVLVLYTVIFIIVLIALSRGNDDNDFDFGDIVAGLFRGIIDAFIWNAILTPDQHYYDDYGNRYRMPGKERNKGKGFIKSVYNFVFGPDRPKYNPLDDSKEVASFIRKNNGKLTAGQIVALTGVDFNEAESRLAEYAVRFQGELIVSNEGTITAEFNDFLYKFSEDLKDGRIEFYEDEVEAPYEITGNTGGKNFAISAMNVFNFIMSTVAIGFLSGGIHFNVDEGTNYEILNLIQDEAGWISFILGYFPLAFSSLFFLIPFVRSFDVKRKQAKRKLNIVRKQIIRYIKMSSGKILFNEIITSINMQEVTIEEVEKVLNKLVLELQGRIDIDELGNPVYNFERFIKEIRI